MHTTCTVQKTKKILIFFMAQLNNNWIGTNYCSLSQLLSGQTLILNLYSLL